MNYPLNFSFKIVALAPQIRVTDASGAQILYVKQKLLKLKEHVEVFTDDSRAQKLCDIRADRVIDWSAAYLFSDPAGNAFGGVRRKGMRSLWRAHYEIFAGDAKEDAQFTIREEKAFVKVMDGIFGDIPVVGMLSGYVFHPSYLITRGDGTPVLRVRKRPAMWEGKYDIELLGELDQSEQVRTLVAVLMMLLLERRRG